MFTPLKARKTLKRYRKKGLEPIERQMVASLSLRDIDGARILEIGGGIGTIQAELLVNGADEGEVVELLSSYEPYAGELAREKGFETRSRFRVADILAQPGAVAPASIVILNRVVCCSPDGVRLTEAAAALAERVLILSLPRDRWLVRVVARVINTAQRLMGRSFRVFLHPRASLYTAAKTRGFLLAKTGRSFVWEFAAFRRA
jgi:magnesium-protoporphyrin O-methyltransferase